MITISSDIYQLLPLALVASAILISLVIEMYIKRSEPILAGLSFVVLILAGYYSLISANANNDGSIALHFNDMFATGGIINLFNFIFTFGSAIVVLLSMPYLKKADIAFGEYYILLLSAVLGMLLLAGARNLLMIFIGLEQMSMSFYILAGIRRRNHKSNEAALKYFLLGSFATGFIVYGMALIYGATRSMYLSDIYSYFYLGKAGYLFFIGLALYVIGFSFKIAAFPFHNWVPDVYQGAPTTVTALMSTTGKAAAFMALILALVPSLTGGQKNILAPYLAVISVLSMLYGSIVAIAQTDLKRMLAYSSIAHAGYMLIGLASGNTMGLAGIVFYLGVYTFMNLGAFGVISLLETKEGENLTIESLAGLGLKAPVYAVLLAIFMFALSGIPPFGGFFGKYYVFYSAIQSGKVWLALFGVLASVISVYFYLRVVVVMYFKKSDKEFEITNSNPAMLGIFISTLIVIAMGVVPDSIIRIINLFVK